MLSLLVVFGVTTFCGYRHVLEVRAMLCIPCKPRAPKRLLEDTSNGVHLETANMAIMD